MPHAGHEAVCATVGTPHVEHIHDVEEADDKALACIKSGPVGGRTSECRLQTAARIADSVVLTPPVL